MIRDANQHDCKVLTEISFIAKSFWNYPDEYMKLWKEELTIRKKYLNNKIVRCYEQEGKLIGFYSIFEMSEQKTFGKVYLEQGFWLDHMFILPKYHKKGIGREFIEDIKILSKKQQIGKSLKIFVDPNAKGFYLKVGAKEIRVSESSIPNRTIPVMEIDL